MRPADLAKLERFSATIGRDPEQVQAAGGNTSLKADNVLWVKASGLWLADAEARDIFVPVRLPEVLDGIRDGLADPVGGAVMAEANPGGLRPSIETTLHALLPHAVVVHTHSVRTLALAIREDGEAELGRCLDGLAWLFVPYEKPGLPLTRTISGKLGARGGSGVDIIVLGNHGLVVGGDTVEAADALLREVERRLEAPVREASPADPARLPTVEGFRPALHARAHGVATDPARLAWATGGSLYPDHVIFLGPAARTPDAEVPGSRLLLVPGAGALLDADTDNSADELALCLALVLERVPEDAPLRYLAERDEAELLDWDAEKYRQALARVRAGH